MLLHPVTGIAVLYFTLEALHFHVHVLWKNVGFAEYSLSQTGMYFAHFVAPLRMRS
jgi:hypothetical protein